MAFCDLVLLQNAVSQLSEKRKQKKKDKWENDNLCIDENEKQTGRTVITRTTPTGGKEGKKKEKEKKKEKRKKKRDGGKKSALISRYAITNC